MKFWLPVGLFVVGVLAWVITLVVTPEMEVPAPSPVQQHQQQPIDPERYISA